MSGLPTSNCSFLNIAQASVDQVSYYWIEPVRVLTFDAGMFTVPEPEVSDCSLCVVCWLRDIHGVTKLLAELCHLVVSDGRRCLFVLIGEVHTTFILAFVLHRFVVVLVEVHLVVSLTTNCGLVVACVTGREDINQMKW